MCKDCVANQVGFELQAPRLQSMHANHWAEGIHLAK